MIDMRRASAVCSAVWLVAAACGDDAPPRDEPDASHAPAPDGGNPIDTSAGDDPATVGHDGAGAVACEGGPACQPGAMCCATGPGTSACDSACSGAFSVAVACDGPEDCPEGQFCCGGIAKSYCAATCDAADRYSCHTPADCPVGIDAACNPNSLFPIWGVCAAS